MATMKCYNCGGEVIVNPGSRIGICSACMAEIPLPEGDDISLQDAYARANTFLSESRFDDAWAAFQEILIQSPMEAAACWGMALSQYGIEFVNDPASGEMLPTLHRLSRDNFSSYLYARKAVEYAVDPELERFYREQCALIDKIQAHSLQISNGEQRYDVFICYKKTEKGEKRTADSRLAGDLYREFTQRGYRVFYADESLTVGEEYEPRIFAALNSARVLVAVASRVDYYEAVWVRNEWSRYADLIRKEEAAGGTKRALIPVFRRLTHDQIPEILRAQPIYVEMDQYDDPKQAILRTVAAQFDKGEAEDTSDLSRAVANMEKKSAAAEYEEYDGDVNGALMRGMLYLVNGDYDEANDLFTAILETGPSAEACMGMLMCELEVPGKEALYRYAGDLREEKYFKLALQAATDEERAEYNKIADTCAENLAWNQKKAAMQKECGEVLEQKTDKIWKERIFEHLSENMKRLMDDKTRYDNTIDRWETEKRTHIIKAGLALANLVSLLVFLFTGGGMSVLGRMLISITYVATIYWLLRRWLPIVRIIVSVFGGGLVGGVIAEFADMGWYGGLIVLAISALVAATMSLSLCRNWTAYKNATRKKSMSARELKETALENEAVCREALIGEADGEFAKYRQYHDEDVWRKIRDGYVGTIRDAARSFFSIYTDGHDAPAGESKAEG